MASNKTHMFAQIDEVGAYYLKTKVGNLVIEDVTFPDYAPGFVLVSFIGTTRGVLLNTRHVIGFLVSEDDDATKPGKPKK